VIKILSPVHSTIDTIVLKKRYSDLPPVSYAGRRRYDDLLVDFEIFEPEIGKKIFGKFKHDDWIIVNMVPYQKNKDGTYLCCIDYAYIPLP